MTRSCQSVANFREKSSPVARLETTRRSAQPTAAVQFGYGNGWDAPLPADLDARQHALLQPDLYPLARHMQTLSGFLGGEQLESERRVVHELDGSDPEGLAELVNGERARGLLAVFQAGDFFMGETSLAGELLLIQSYPFTQGTQPPTSMEGV